MTARTGSSTALDRLQRLLTMVPWLLGRGGATLEELSDRFNVPRRQLLTDLDVLGYCGVPGYGGGDLIEVVVDAEEVTIRLAEHLSRPLALTADERVALLLAARACATIVPGDAALARALAKLESVCGSEPEGVLLDLPEAGGAAGVVGQADDRLAVLTDALAARRVVELTYRGADRATTRRRTVEPWTLLVAQGHVYLRGHCRRAGARRDFRLDRMRAVVVTDEAAPQPPPDADASPVSYRPAADDLRVVLDCGPQVWWLLDTLPIEACVDGPTGKRVTVAARSLDWAAQLVAELGGHARVLAPDELADLVRRRAAAALAHYRSATEAGGTDPERPGP